MTAGLTGAAFEEMEDFFLAAAQNQRHLALVFV